MKALICGGRDFLDDVRLAESIIEVQRVKGKISCVIQGGARGADRLAKDWAIVSGIPMIEMPANWLFYGKSAGAIRNASMLQFGKPDIVIAFPGGRGTADMIKKAEAAGVEVWLA
jgi:hypothetical protein